MTGPLPAKGHMPFFGHRTQAEVRHDEERRELYRCRRAFTAAENFYERERARMEEAANRFSTTFSTSVRT